MLVSDGTKWEGLTSDKGKEKGKTEKWTEKKDKSRYVLAEKSYILKASKEGYYEDKEELNLVPLEWIEAKVS